MSVRLPRRWHSAAFSQNANLKTTLLLGKLHNIVKFPNYSTSECRQSNHLRRHRQGSRYCVFHCDRGSLRPPWLSVSVTLADGCHTDGCALKFFVLASKDAAIQWTCGSRDVKSRDLRRGLECWGVWTLAEKGWNWQRIGLRSKRKSRSRCHLPWLLMRWHLVHE